MNNEPLVELHQVLKIYRSPSGAFTALHNIDLHVCAGEFVAVVGRSGSGKTTLTVAENVMLPMDFMRSIPASDRRSRALELLERVGIGNQADKLPAALSGGEQQRAAIARAVISRPELLLADEPTGNVDPNLAQRLLRLFVELNRSGTSVVIATHDLVLMNQFDARRLVLHDGQLHVLD